MAPLTGTLEADVVTTIELGPRVYEVTVATDHDDIWFTTDGSDPYDGSPAAHHVLNYARSMTVPVGGGNETKLLKLWSATTPTYTVTVGAPADTSFTSLDHAGTDHTDIPGVGGGEGGVSIPESDTPPEDPEVGDLWLDTGTDAEQSGATVDWAAVVEPTISLTATTAEGSGLVATADDAGVALAATGANGTITVAAPGAGGTVNISASGSVRLAATDGPIVLGDDEVVGLWIGPDGQINLRTTLDGSELGLTASGDNGAVNILASGADGIVNIEAPGTGGEVRVKLRSPDGTVFLLKVADDGTLSTQDLSGP